MCANTCTTLTQPTGIGRGKGWFHYISPLSSPLVGFHWGDFVSHAGRGWNALDSIGVVMLQRTMDQTDSHTRIISTLTRLRLEWQEATNGASLLETDGKIGLVLADLINGFGLDVNDQCQILGNDLFLELKDFLYAP